METKQELETKISILDKTGECEKHGRIALKICMEPGCNTVYCGECVWGSCQCWNDE